MTEKLIETSKRFWKAMEQSDVAVMEEIAHKDCCFVHIGVTCGLHSQAPKLWGDAGIVITDCDYGLLLGGKPTTHHFAVTEVYTKDGNDWKLVQFSFTALVY